MKYILILSLLLIGCEKEYKCDKINNETPARIIIRHEKYIKQTKINTISKACDILYQDYQKG